MAVTMYNIDKLIFYKKWCFYVTVFRILFIYKLKNFAILLFQKIITQLFYKKDFND